MGGTPTRGSLGVEGSEASAAVPLSAGPDQRGLLGIVERFLRLRRSLPVLGIVTALVPVVCIFLAQRETHDPRLLLLMVLAWALMIVGYSAGALSARRDLKRGARAIGMGATEVERLWEVVDRAVSSSTHEALEERVIRSVFFAFESRRKSSLTLEEAKARFGLLRAPQPAAGVLSDVKSETVGETGARFET